MHHNSRMIKMADRRHCRGPMYLIPRNLRSLHRARNENHTGIPSCLGYSQIYCGQYGTPLSVCGVFILWLIAFVGLRRLLGAENAEHPCQHWNALGIVGCAVMVQMRSCKGRHEQNGSSFLSATSESERQSAVALYKGLRFIDYGMDLAFDTFFFSAWTLLGFKMLRHPNFGKVFGGIGIVLFVLAAIFNLRAAPDPPAFDIGPIAALWVLAVYIQTLRSAKSFPDFQAEPPKFVAGEPQ